MPAELRSGAASRFAASSRASASVRGSTASRPRRALAGRVRNDATGRHDRRVRIRARRSTRSSARLGSRLVRRRAADDSRAARRSAIPARAGRRVLDRSERGERRAADLDPARPGDLPGVPRRDLRSGESPVSLSVHQLHELRSALHDRARRAVRPAGHDDGGVPDVPGVPARVRARSTIGDSTPSRTPVPVCGPRLTLMTPRRHGRRRRRSDRRGCGRAAVADVSSPSRGSADSISRATRRRPRPCERLRARKRRDEKPFAVMVRDLARGRRRSRCSTDEERAAADVGRASDRAGAPARRTARWRRRWRPTTRSSAWCCRTRRSITC